MADLEEINNKLTKLCVHVENIKEDITDMRVEREKHKDAFWENMNQLKLTVQNEEIKRIEGDNILNTDIKVMKGKFTVITGFVALVVTLFINWIRTYFK